ncbi:Xaa-Pro peptidase family protein [Rhizobium sp. RU36D]|uniref:M24 family metallopeptidase n=1 Tax=Rhizobium sp. RU36D TaxID=1907415 RepID=UPI0009D8B093|nr:Xaa-Pro peptidase family protein [Rhizobium sp. RU36D]SMC51151.1 Xaa-Pro aminopeptidase [Rhizobium sp. RU36D]
MTSALAPLGPDFHRQTVAAVQQTLSERRLEGALFLMPANVQYLCGWRFSVNERPIGLLVRQKGEPLLLVPDLERENAMAVPGVEVECYEEFPGETPPVLWMAERAGVRSLAIDQLDAVLLAPLQAMMNEVRLQDLAAPLRFIKTPAELALVREAARFADLCLTRLLSQAGTIIASGGTELDLLDDCTGFARAALVSKHGETFAGTKLGITASVHSGPRAALPHGATSRRRPQHGETLIAGIGASLGGYHAESGITLVIGDMSPEQHRIMQAMQACNDAAIANLTPGAECAEVNRAALDALRQAGLSDTIRHRIGHGMGLEGHEAPWLAPGDRTAVATGMVFSNEPGVYRPGRDGYRTINTMIVTETGVEIPSRFQADHPIETRVITLS